MICQMEILFVFIYLFICIFLFYFFMLCEVNLGLEFVFLYKIYYLVKIILKGVQIHSSFTSFVPYYMNLNKNFRYYLPTWQVANEIKLGSPRHYLPRGSLLCVWLRRHRISSAPVSLLQHFWFLMGISSFLDWFFGGRSSHYPRSLCSVYLLSWRSPCSPVVSAGHLVSLRLGRMDWTKSSLIQKRGKLRHSYVGQGQDALF
jgi:hypothetical protein